MAGNSHKVAKLGDKMFYFQPQSLVSKWQDTVCLILSLDLVSDVSSGWPELQAITAAHKVSERCSLGAEARSDSAELCMYSAR